MADGTRYRYGRVAESCTIINNKRRFAPRLRGGDALRGFIKLYINFAEICLFERKIKPSNEQRRLEIHSPFTQRNSNNCFILNHPRRLLYPTFQRYPGILVSWKIGKKDFSSSGRASCTGNGAHERAADALTGNQDNVRGHTGVS